MAQVPRIPSALTAEYVDDVSAVVHCHEGDLAVVAVPLALVVQRQWRLIGCQETKNC